MMIEYTKQPINVEELFMRVSGNKEFIKNVLSNFFDSYLERINIIEYALKKEDFQVAKKTSHKLAGVLGNLSIPKAYFLTKELEDIINYQNQDMAFIWLKDIKDNIKNAKTFFQENQHFF